MAKKKKQDGINRDEIEEEYGLSFALFKAYPELYQLLRKAVKENYTPAKFQTELRQTNWFKKHSDVWRQNIALKHADPSSYRERLANSRTSVQNLAASFGARLSGKALNRLAERALLFGMSEDQIRDVLANHVRPSEAGHFGGQLAGVEDGLRGIALRNGVRLGNTQMQNWMRQIVRGNASQEQYETYIRDVAAKTFTAYGDQIRGGMDMADVASPYVQSMSDILELNPGGLDLYDPTIRRALSYKNDKGEQVPMSITDFEHSLRQDKRWQYTKQAKDSAKGWAVAIARNWGLA